MKRRAQSYSMDIVLAVVIFGFLAVTFTSFTLLDRPNIASLQQEAQQVSFSLENPIIVCDNAPVLSEGSLDRNTTSCLFNQSYPQLKELFNTRGDFCIYLENQDGQLIPIRINETTNKYTIGSPEVNVSGIPCGVDR